MAETDGLNQTEEEQVMERIVRNQLLIKELEEENTLLKAYFKQSDAYPAGLTKEVGKFFIKVSKSTRIDDALARVKLDPDTYDRLSKKVIDGAAAKKALPTEEYNAICKTYENRIEIGLI